MAHKILFATLLIAFSLPASASYYKCTDTNGDIRYQNTRCAGEQDEKRLRVDAPPDVPATSRDDGLIQTCFNVKKISLKDPDSAKLEHGFVVPKALKLGVVGRQVVLTVNAKNSYGGYTGGQIYSCLMTQQGKILPDSEMVE